MVIYDLCQYCLFLVVGAVNVEYRFSMRFAKGKVRFFFHGCDIKCSFLANLLCRFTCQEGFCSGAANNLNSVHMCHRPRSGRSQVVEGKDGCIFAKSRNHVQLQHE